MKVSAGSSEAEARSAPIADTNTAAARAAAAKKRREMKMLMANLLRFSRVRRARSSFPESLLIEILVEVFIEVEVGDFHCGWRRTVPDLRRTILPV